MIFLQVSYRGRKDIHALSKHAPFFISWDTAFILPFFFFFLKENVFTR